MCVHLQLRRMGTAAMPMRFFEKLLRHGCAGGTSTHQALVPVESGGHNSAAVCELGSESFLRGIRDEMLDLHHHEKLIPNFTRVLSRGKNNVALRKFGIYEQNLPLPEGSGAYPHLEKIEALAPELASVVNEGMSTAASSIAGMEGYVFPELHAPSIKIQVNTGDGACFPFHVDATPEDPRVLTLLIYLNDDSAGGAGSGGDLVCYPLPYSPESFPPALGNIVAFSSQSMLHSTVPWTGESMRCCLTFWFPCVAGQVQKSHWPSDHGLQTQRQLVGEDTAEVLKLLLSPAIRPHFSRLVTAGPWIRSLVESHLDHAIQERGHETVASGVEEYMTTFRSELRLIETGILAFLGEHGYRWTAEDLQMLARQLPLGRGPTNSVGGWWPMIATR